MRYLNLRSFKTHNLAVWIFILGFLLSGCSNSQLPIIHTALPESELPLKKSCNDLFPQNNIQFVHSLDVRLPGHNATSVIGITNINPSERSLESVIVTVEGLVVFHARFAADKKEVLKSIDPFTSEQFSDGLLRDIQLIFLIPDGNLVQMGNTGDNSTICRYRTQKGSLVDILLHQDGNWNLKQYNGKRQLLRSVTTSLIEDNSQDPLTRFPKKMILESSGIFGYSLIMNLLRVEYTNKTP